MNTGRSRKDRLAPIAGARRHGKREARDARREERRAAGPIVDVERAAAFSFSCASPARLTFRIDLPASIVEQIARAA